MNRILHSLFALSLAMLFAQAACAESAPNQKVRLLIFGNSFSVNSTGHLTELAKEGKKELVFLNLIKGGCSLREHAEAVKAAQTDPESAKARFYGVGGTLMRSFPQGKKANAAEAMKAGPFDYVSIQQYSLLSFKGDTFEPYAKELIEFINANAPQAKIIVHQTWAYREDDPLFKDGKFTSEQMYAALKANYARLATDYHLRTLPIGDAFQAARKTPEWSYVPDASFDFKNPPPGTLPNQKGSLNVGWIWKKAGANIATPEASPTSEPDAAKDPKSKLSLDAHHANTAGCYLGSCVWYEFLFNDDVTALTQYTPRGLTPEQAASLRKLAHETVARQKQAEASLK